MALIWGPRPADEALRTLEAVSPENPPPLQLLFRACLLAMLGRIDEASSLARSAEEKLREQTGDYGGEDILATIATLDGDYETGVQYLRGYCDTLEAHGFRSTLSTTAPRLGRWLCKLGHYAKAEPLAQLGRELGNEDDVETQALWREVQALVDAHQGAHTTAETMACEALAITTRTDALNMQGDALCDLAEVLATAGRDHEAAAALERGLDRYQRKRNLAMVAQVGPRLDALRAKVQAHA